MLQKSPLAADQREAAVQRRLGTRSDRQGRPGGAHRGHDRRSGLDGDDHRRDRRARSIRSPDRSRARIDKEMTIIHRCHPPRQLADASSTSSCRSSSSRACARRTSNALKDASAERARAGPALEQRRGARQGAPADEHLPRHAVRPLALGTVAGIRCDHARRREGIRAAGITPGESDASASAATRPTSWSGSFRRGLARCRREPPPSALRSPARRRRASRSKSSRRTRAPPQSRSGFRSMSRARIRTSLRCRWRAPGSASIGSSSGACTSAFARSAA